MSTIFSILILVAPVAGILYLIYRHNFQGRRSLSRNDKFRGMAPWIGVLVFVPILLFAAYLILDIDPCRMPFRRRTCLAE